MARRSSACGVMAVMAVLANGLPLDLRSSSTSLTCNNDGAMQAIQANLAVAEPFCNSYVKQIPAIKADLDTLTITTTITPGVTTVTQTSIGTPTLVMTIADDFVITTTTTVTKATCVSTSSASTQTGTKSGPVRGGVTHGKRATEATAEAESASELEPESTTLDARDDQLPDYLSSFQAAEVSNACSCLQASKVSGVAASVTTTVTTTVTASPITGEGMTVTKTWITMLPSAVVRLEHVGATHIVQKEACVTSSPGVKV